MNIGLFYGSSTCYTEMAAEKIRDIIGPELVTLHNLKDDSPALMSQYDVLILGIPTWDFGEIQEDWEAVWDQLDTLNLEGKIVALYGMGDQLGYGEWFLDALGMLHDKLATRGVKFVGYWPTEGYEFTSPKPVIADGQLFVGLALDETNQYDLSDERIQSWCEQILGEMAEHFPDAAYSCAGFCSTSRRRSRHSPASMLSAASQRCCPRRVSTWRKRSSIPLLITHGVPRISHSAFCQRRRESVSSFISPRRAWIRRWLRTQSKTTSDSSSSQIGV